MIGFDAPYMLWGLVGLLIPILIHLWSKREQQVIMVGSVDMFDESETIRSRKIRPNEFLLLFLRCLLIALLVAWLAGIHWEKTPTPKAITYLVDPALKNHPYIADSILPLGNGAWLMPGYPPLTQDSEPDSTFNRWKTASLFPMDAFDSVVIIASSRQANYKEIRPNLPPASTWITLDVLGATPASNVRFATEKTPVKVGIHVSKTQTESVTRLMSVLNKLDSALGDLEIQYTDEPAFIGIWHSEKNPPEDAQHWLWIRDYTGDIEFDERNIWIPDDINEQEVIQSNIIFNLLNYIRLNNHNSSNDSDFRTLYSVLASPGISTTNSSSTNIDNHQPWLWLLLIGITLITERYLSFHKQL